MVCNITEGNTADMLPEMKSVKVPRCASCHLPLGANLVAARCNCVFHRNCAPDGVCPRCGKNCAGGVLLDLYAVSFGNGDEPPATASTDTVQSLDSSADRTGPQAVAVRDEAVALCELQEKASKRRRAVEQLQARILALKEANLQKQKKLQDVEKAFAKRTAERDSHIVEIDQAAPKYDELCKHMQQSRQRGAILEYRDILRGKSASEALTYLTTMATASLDPVPMLIELARLRDYHRARLVDWQRQAAASRQKESFSLFESEERRRKIADLRRQLQRRAGDASVEKVLASYEASAGTRLPGRVGDDEGGGVAAASGSRGGTRQTGTMPLLEDILSQPARLPATPASSQASSQGSSLFPEAKRLRSD